MAPALQEHALLLCIAQLAVLLGAARALGEVARRLGQSPVVGELLAGILLGPSALGVLAPELQSALFPPDATQRALLDLVAWLGVILLLLTTGLETDVGVLRNLSRVALYVSVAGMVVPFAAGLALGGTLPDRLLVDPSHRVVFALFFATAMSISAIPVIARILIDLDLMRRNVGVVILGAGVADDTTGWLLLSVISAAAARGDASLVTALLAVGSTALFLGVAYLVGRPLVTGLLRWVDDRVGVPHALTTAVVVVTLVCSALTELIGIHAVFGAFVAGILVARSPRLRQTTTLQIEGILLAVFAPIFFASVGLKVDLAHGFELGTTLAVLGIACAGKLVGASAGAYWAGLGTWESLAVGAGMNARGAMELVVALIGLSLGILSPPVYAAIVIVAVVTTAMTPPLLGWIARRIPVAPDEAERLRAFEARKRALIPASGLKVLLPTGGGHNAERAMALVAPLVAGDPAATVVALHVARPTRRRWRRRTTLRDQLAEHLETLSGIARAAGAPAPTVKTESGTPAADVILREAARGYDLLVLGASEDARRHPLGGEYVRAIATGTPCPLLVVRGGRDDGPPSGRIVVPVSGSAQGRAAIEFALLYAHRVRARVHAIHVLESSYAFYTRSADAEVPADWAASAEALLVAVREQAVAAEVSMVTETIEAPSIEAAVTRASKGADLLVLGAASRPHARRAFFGTRVEAMLTHAPSAVAVVLLRQ